MRNAAFLFLIIAIISALLAYKIATDKVSTSKTTSSDKRIISNGIESNTLTENTSTESANGGFGALSLAIISGSCFCCAAYLVSRGNK